LFKIRFNGNDKLREIYNRVKKDQEIQAYWAASNITAIDRMHISDHGRVHIAIVVNRALKILRLLKKNDVVFNIEKDHGMKYEDAEVLVFTAAVLHDIGQAIHRSNHAVLGAAIAPMLVDRLLKDIYCPAEKARMLSDICHAIISHREGIDPLTVEAGIIRVADAIDMERGRAEISFSKIGSTSIHAVSAMAIKDVKIKPGKLKPVRILITMANSSGIFQVDSLLKNKLKNSCIENYIEVRAFIEGEVEEKIISVIEI